MDTEGKKTFSNSFVDAEENKERIEKMFIREERRFKRADADNNKKLNDKEYYAFMHPENHPDMKDLVVEETLDDMDTNKDGFLSLDEFVGRKKCFSLVSQFIYIYTFFL